MSSSAEGNDLRISLDVADRVPFSAIGDSGPLRQILLNLLPNAVNIMKHDLAGTLEKWLSTRRMLNPK